MSKDKRKPLTLNVRGMPTPAFLINPSLFPEVAANYQAGREAGALAGFVAGVKKFEERNRRPLAGLPTHKMGGDGPDVDRLLQLSPETIAGLSEKELDSIIRLKAELDKLPHDQAKKVYAKIIRGEREKVRIENERRWQVNEQAEYMQKILRATDSSIQSLKVLRVEKSSFPDLREAARRDQVMYLTDPSAKCMQHAQISRDYEREIFKHAQVFLMQHDWAAAFDKADLSTEFRLPYEICAFEFNIGGTEVIALCVQNEADVNACLAGKTKEGWLVHDFSLPPFLSDDMKHERLDSAGIFTFVMRQVAAVCIALDAEVAESEVVREKHERSHKQRDYTKQPLTSYHVVSLARRTRAPRLEGAEPTGRRMRLHFRRGHWRHYDDHKTWIKWMLVGDPDLGFIDKHYKL